MSTDDRGYEDLDDHWGHFQQDGDYNEAASLGDKQLTSEQLQGLVERGLVDDDVARLVRTAQWDVPPRSLSVQQGTQTARVLQLAEELVGHLRRALDEREELLRRLTAALGSVQHAQDRIDVLEAHVSVLEGQLREAAASVASGKPALVDQSKASLIAMATAVVALLSLASAIAAPFVSDWLASDDTSAIVDAQRETTAAIEAMSEPAAVDLSVEAALRCLIEGDAG